MSQIKTVFTHTLKVAVKKKAFIISTIIMIVIALIVAIAPRGIEALTGGEKTEKDAGTYYYVDPSGIIPSGPVAIKEASPGAKVKVIDEAKASKLEKSIADKKTDGTIVTVGESNGKPIVQVSVMNFMNAGAGNTVSTALTKAYGRDVLSSGGVSKELLDKSGVDIVAVPKFLSKTGVSDYILSLLLIFLFFFAVYYYGYAVAMSIATEKSSRVMETLVVSASPQKILIGKIMAMGMLGLGQIIVIIGAGAVFYNLFVPEGFTVMGMKLSLEGINPVNLTVLLVYLILGYLLYAVLNSVCGALVSKIEDLQSAMMPVTMIALVSFYIGYISAAMGNNDGLIQKIAIYLPFSSPFAIQSQLVQGNVGPMQIAISLILLIVTIVIITLISGKIYAASVLHYGKPGRILKLYKTKI